MTNTGSHSHADPDKDRSDRLLPSAILTTSYKPLSKKVSPKKIKAQQKAVSFALANYRNSVWKSTPDGGSVARFVTQPRTDNDGPLPSTKTD
jgi:hypothetical protein